MTEAFLGIQIIATLFAVFMIYISFIHYKQENIVKHEFYFWLFLWLGFVYFTLFPRVLDPVMAKLFITRRMDLLMIIAFMILAYLGFQNHIGVKYLQSQLEKMVRQNAIKNASKKKS